MSTSQIELELAPTDVRLWEAELAPSTPERIGLSDDNRLLTEVDHLLRARIRPSVFDEMALVDVRQNLVTSIQEQAMPAAVTETRHEALENPERKGRIFMWMGKTAVENAMTGYNYHRHQSALRRVDVEVDEAEYAGTMIYGKARVMISPRMTRKDDTFAVAREEHVGDDDAVRVSWLEDTNGKTERVMQSLLVKNVPFEAWVALLEDENNLFGRAVSLEDRESALSVMKAHRQLELPVENLPRGPVSLVEAVIPYIKDINLRKKVITQARNYVQKDQEQMRRDAEDKADEWLEFEKQLTESVAQEAANKEVKEFVASLASVWSREDLAIIQAHTSGSVLRMSRELAAVLESAQQRLLSGRAAVLADEEFVLKQVGSVEALRQMQDTERLITMARQGWDDTIYRQGHMMLIAQQNHVIARHNIRAGGGGCPGENRTKFGTKDGLFEGDIIYELQNILGGKLSDLISIEGQSEQEVESDEDGPLVFECTEGHTNRRPRNGRIDRCWVSTCPEGSVGCND